MPRLYPKWMGVVMLVAGAYNLAWGLIVVALPTLTFRYSGLEKAGLTLHYPQLWQCVGMIVGVYGIGYALAALDPIRHWPIVLIGLLGKIFGPLGYVIGLIRGETPPELIQTIVFNDLIWWVPFGLILWHAYRVGRRELGAPPALGVGEALDRFEISPGVSLAARSRESPILLAFVRHLGCTYCREMASDLGRALPGLRARGVEPAVVHMATEDEGRAFLARYGLASVAAVSDPGCALYRAFGLGRGSAWQLLGPKALARFPAAGAGGGARRRLPGRRRAADAGRVRGPRRRGRRRLPPRVGGRPARLLRPHPRGGVGVSRPDVVIVGAGLAGLACARRLHQVGHTFQVVEAADAVGGRVRTDLVDGFRLDRGFQIYLTAYPEGRRVLDYDALDLKPFVAGAEVFLDGQFRRVADPRAEPLTGVRSVFNPVGGLGDKLRLAKLKLALDAKLDRDGEPPESEPDTSTQAYLAARFTPKLIEPLFRPFMGGVFLEPRLTTSSRFFEFVFRCFGRGVGAVPALGMQRIPEQLAANLPAGSVRLNAPAESIAPGVVRLASGEAVECRAVVVAARPDGCGAADRRGGRRPRLERSR